MTIRFIIQNYDPALIEAYLRYSLRHERKLHDQISRRIETGGGEVWPIEQRMLKSLDRTARIAGIRLEDIDLKDKSPWGGKHLHQKTKDVGWEHAYDAVVGGMSHNVHGSWQDLYAHHLEAEQDGSFSPKLEWSRPRPQPLFALGLLTLEVVRDVVLFLGGQAALADLEDKLTDLHERILYVNDAHEAYLSGKTWPEI